MGRLFRWIGAGLLWLVILLCLTLTIVPHFLDARYYRGPVSDHFDGERFFNPDGDDGLPVANTGTMLRYIAGSDDRPKWPSRVAVAPTRPPARVDGERMLVTWIGHSSVLVQTAGINILTDPVWSKSAGPWGFGPTRVAEPGIRFDDLPRIDLVLVSHDHYDHMDLATLKRLSDRDKPMIVTSLGNDSVISQAGVPATARDWGGRVEVRAGIEVIVNRGHHWDSRWFADRNRALWSSFVVTLPGGNLFFAGDTGAGDFGWADKAVSYGPIRLALIPIGAFRFAPGQMAAGSHIGPLDAVEVFRRLGASHAIGVHWGTFRLSYEGWDTPPRLLAAAEKCTGQSGFDALPIGRTVAIPPYAAPRPRPAMPRAELLHCLETSGAAALP
ncbi:MBL fold metallo-hydrolase [Sphingomonas bacterium]|uniref:MBL fold metallo-hydrolase n=1 Tax=Sphingomonas bacterium TaxID=1895847 RepID=UPI0026393509|nr:MBL fold metallo-hydrolase [Sphingomonas bacterium]MDB5677987.1 Zn-dependent hydrolase [Sphingomonas bacterium]